MAAAILISVAGQEAEILHNPADAVLHAVRDMETLPADARTYVRYLTLYNIPAKALATEIKVLNGHLQHLSREPDLQPGYLVPGSGGTLLRVNIQDYGWSVKTWEALANEDPYFHVDIVHGAGASTTATGKDVVNWPGGIWPGDGKFYAKDSFTFYQERPTVTKRAIAPLFTQSPAHVAALGKVVADTQSQVPILRADWFFNQTAAVVNRKTNYYTFLDMKTQKDFEERIGFDRRIAKRFVILRDALAESDVTLQPRAVVREDKGYWRTLDFIVAKDKTNPLEINNEDIENDADVTEAYGFLPNNFWVTAAVNLKNTAELKAGQLAAIVPQTIASDNRSRSNDKSIHPNASCMRCHFNGGLIDLNEAWYRSLIANKALFNFVNYDDAKKFRQQYVARRLEPWITKDRTAFAEAVFLATGYGKVADYTTAYAATWERYEDAKVDLAWAARDLGVSPQVMRDALMVKAELNQARTVLTGLAIGKRIGIRQWEQYFQLAYLELTSQKKGNRP